jgi:hypothetical protein
METVILGLGYQVSRIKHHCQDEALWLNCTSFVIRKNFQSENVVCFALDNGFSLFG